jgi:mRNA interferase MazF
VKRGEIYVVDLGPGVGREVSGVSPVVIVSNNVNNITPLFVTILPAVDVSDIRAVLGTIVSGGVSGHSADLSVLSKQPRTLDASRFTAGPVGTVPIELMLKISFALQEHLGLENVPLPPRP